MTLRFAAITASRSVEGSTCAVGAAQQLSADLFALGADHGFVAQVAVLEEHVHFGGPQRRLDAGGLVPQMLGAFGHALVDKPPERRVQPPGQDARHLAAPLGAPWPATIVFDNEVGVTNIGIQSSSNETWQPEPGRLALPPRGT